MPKVLSKSYSFNPWLDSPPPSAPYLQYASLRWFIARSHENYHYRINGSKLYFYEIHGHGPPQNDIGYPGDIYVDLTPLPYLIYVREQNQWVCWNWSPTHPSKKLFGLVRHPLITGRILWVCAAPSNPHLSWYHPRTVRNKKGVALKGRHDIGLIASRVVSTLKFKISPENLQRREEETRRRRDILIKCNIFTTKTL